MVWYENLDRSKPYLNNYRGWNLWYNFNNGKHHEMKRLRVTFVEHWFKRMAKLEGNQHFMFAVLMVPFYVYLYKTYKRFQLPKDKEEEPIFTTAQYIASLGRNQYGFETRATKSFEHAFSVLLGSEILGHILNQDSDYFRQEELEDEDGGLVGDFSEEDIVGLRKEEGHVPHVGIVFFKPEKHYLNEKPNDFLSPYKIVGEKKLEKNDSHDSHYGHKH